VKTCSRCGIAQPFDNFHKESRHTDGLRADCKSCRAKHRKPSTKHYYRTHREQILKNQSSPRYKENRNRRRRKKLTPKIPKEPIQLQIKFPKISVTSKSPAKPKKSREEKLTKKRQYGKQYYQRNRPKILARQKRYKISHAKDIKEKKRKWSKKDHQLHPEKAWKRKAIRRARMRSSPIITIINRNTIYERDEGICHICYRKVSKKSFSIDHLIPLAAGGSHTPENVALAHLKCNLRRGNGKLPAQLRLIG
jgi:hypothetical protein